MPISPSKTPLTASTSSSAPARPLACSLSASAVKPERSIETSEPSSSRHGRPARAPPSRERAVAGTARTILAASRSPRPERKPHGACVKARPLPFAKLGEATNVSRESYSRRQRADGGRRESADFGAIAVVVGVLAAAAMPGVAPAHHEPPVNYVSTAADGAHRQRCPRPGEWADVPSYFVIFGEISGRSGSSTTPSISTLP